MPTLPKPLIIAWFVGMLSGFSPNPALATWSIVAVDRDAGEVGGASATCTPWARAIFGPVPGKGIIVTQAASNKIARRYGESLLRDGKGPRDIIAAITHPAFDPSYPIQQHGVAVLEPGAAPAGFTGSDIGRVAADLQGPGVSVQGNILVSREVLSAGLRTFQATSTGAPYDLAERLLRALEAGSRAGGDRRCGDQTAISAYLVVARPGDPAGKPSIQLFSGVQAPGGENAVTVLRRLFNERRAGRQ